MQFAKKVLMVAGAVALTGLFAATLAPRAAHAVVSTLVTVVNSVAVVNPTISGGAIQGVVTEETDGASRQPITSGCEASSQANAIGGFGCAFTLIPNGTVPAGKRLVIEYVSADCSSPSTVFGAIFTATTSGSSTPNHLALVPQGKNLVLSNEFAVAQSLRLYADPLSEPSVNFSTNDSTGQTSCEVQFSGYLEPANVQ